MKTMLALVLMTTAAVAQFKAQRLEGEGNFIAMECVVAKVIPPDHDRDPAYKVSLTAEFNPDNGKVLSFDAVHTAVSGAKYRRSTQYSNGTLVGNRDRIQWSGWRFGNTQMVGILHFGNGRWLYDEQVGKNGRIQTTINTVCHAEAEGRE
jgi:hypothetical protein